jgi:hypothetical protein
MLATLQLVHCTPLARRMARDHLVGFATPSPIISRKLGFKRQAPSLGPAFAERKESGGLGSSHTTPCGAAVPARPPTRSQHITGPGCLAQWAARLINWSTRVVVPACTPPEGLPIAPTLFFVYSYATARGPERGLQSSLWTGTSLGLFTPLRNPPGCPVTETTKTASSAIPTR